MGLLLIAVRCAVIPLAFDPRAAVAFELPKASVSRAVMYPLIGLLAIYLTRRNRKLNRGALLLFGAVAVVVGVNVVSTAAAAHMPTALFGAPSRQLGLITLMDNAVFAVAVSLFIRTPRDLGIASSGAGLGLALVVAYAVVQYLHLDPVPWTEGPSLSSTVGNTGPLAEYLFACASALCSTVLLFRSRMAGRRAIWLALGGLVVAGMTALTDTRATLVTAPIVAAILGAAVWPHAVTASVGFGAKARIVFGLGAAVLVVASLPTVSRTLNSLRSGDTSSSERTVIYEAGVASILARPILGWGPDAFVVVYPRFRPIVSPAAATLDEDSPHSWVIKAGVDTGILGLLAFGMLALGGVVAAFRSLRRTLDPIALVALCLLTTYLLVGLFTTNDVATEWIFWAGIGLAISSLLALPESHPPPARRSSSRRRPDTSSMRSKFGDVVLGVAVLIIGLLASSTTVHAVTASQLAKVAARSLAAGNNATAEAAARRSIAEDQNRGVSWNLLGAALAASGRSAEAITAFGSALQREPYNAMYLANLANEELRAFASGRTDMADRAVEHARRAAESAPGDPSAQFAYARVLQILGRDPRVARSAIAQVLRWRPNDIESLRIAEQIDEQAKDLPAAISWQRKIVALEPSTQNRLRLAHLLTSAGQVADARLLIAPPTVVGVDRDCIPQNGLAPRSTGPTPLCIRVRFKSEERLLADPSQPGGALRSDNYRLNGSSLPDGSVLSYDPIQNVVVVQFPRALAAPEGGLPLSVSHVADLLGATILPDPTVVTLP